MKKISTLLLLMGLLFSAVTLDAALPKYKQALADPNNKQNSTSDITIYVPGEKLDGNWYSPAKIYHIPKVGKEWYMQNMVYVKTKTALLGDTKKKNYASSMLAQSIKDLAGVSIRAPFAEITGDKPLSGKDYGVNRIYEMSYTTPVDPYDLCKELMNNPDVEYAVPVFIHKTYDYTPNDPKLTQQYLVTAMNLKKAWDISKGDPTIKIAVVDNAVDVTHEDLAANIWTNPNEILDGKDNDGNGKIDDINGWDFVGNVTNIDLNMGAYKEDNNTKPASNSISHGTHVSGCAAAVGDNSKGIAGAAFKCSIIPVKCGTDNPNLIGIYRGYEGILYAAKLGADIINCSWGGPGGSLLEQDIINQAVALGSLVVVAAGNDGKDIDKSPQYPACFDNVVCVGASTSTDKSAYYSNFGYTNTVYAPGSEILSSIPGNSYKTENGTSMASPVTAGMAALIKSIHKDWTPAQIMRQMRSTCDNVISPNVNRPLYYGRINAYTALTYNNKSFPGKVIPGCDIIQTKIGSSDRLTNNSSTNMSLKLKNFLAPTQNLVVRINILDDYASIDQNEFNLGAVSQNEEKDLDFNITLKTNNPWYNGSVRVLVTMVDQNQFYTDYKLIQVPIYITTTNKFATLTTFPDYFKFAGYGGHAFNKSICWIVGYESYSYQMGAFFNYNGVSAKYNLTGTNEPLYTVYGFDGAKAYAASGNSGSTPANLYKTTTGGVSWDKTPLTGVTNFVNYLYFFDNNNGVFIGDPLNNKWGIQLTNDGGAKWTNSTVVPSPQTGESGYVGAHTVLGNRIWFGTSAGRVFTSSNKGAGWNAYNAAVGNHILFMSFSSKDSGMVVYSQSTDLTKPQYLANTVDGGKTWKSEIFNFSTIKAVPVHLYCIPNTSIYNLLSSDGRIYASNDLGLSWHPVLSKQIPPVSFGVGTHEGKSLRLWSASGSISYLDYDLPVVNANRDIALVTASQMNFGKIKIGESYIDSVKIKNNGNVNILFETPVINILSGGTTQEFRTMLGNPTTLEPGETGKFRIKFTPTVKGVKFSELVINSTGAPSTIKVTLTGEAEEALTKVISTNGLDNIEFDSVEVNSNKTMSLWVYNKGNSDINISSASIADTSVDFQDEFSLVNPFTGNIAVNDSIEYKVKFNPLTIGLRTADLKINSDASPNLLNIKLSGYGKNSSAVLPGDNFEFTLNELSPNPVNSTFTAILESKADAEYSINIYSAQGSFIANVFKGIASLGKNFIIYDASSLPQGAYFLQTADANGNVLALPFTVVK